jgi:hypothetical protein
MMKPTFRLDDIQLDTTSAEFAAPTPEALAKSARTRPAPKRRQQFTIVPQAWSGRLRNARLAATLKLAIFLLYQHWWTKGRPIKLTNVAAAKAGVSSDQKPRALEELELLGLVAVERRPKKSPVVALLVG